MATASEEALRAIFEQIRDERKTHANTATRIGDAFLSLLSHLDNGTFLRQGDTESTEYILSVTGGASASLTKLFTLETVTEQGEERVTLATPLAPFKELELRDYLQIGDARLRWDSERQALYVIGKDGSTPVGFYSTGWISAKGANDTQGEGGGGGISYSRLDSWEGYTEPDMEGWVLSAKLGYRLYKDINDLKSGVAMSYAVTGTGNAITDVTRDGSRWVFTKGKTFSELWHTHTLSDIYNLHSSWDALLKAAPAAYVTRWPTAAEVGALTQSAADSRYAMKTVTISAGAGLTGGGNLSANRTLSLAAVGTAGTYTKVTVDAYGRVTAHAALSAADIPSLSISKISGLQAALDAKLPAATFEELFEKVTLSTGETAIRAKFGLYSDKWLSAKGANPNQGEGGGGLSYSRLDTWEGYTDEEKGGWVLSAYLGVRLHQDIENLKSGVAMSYAVTGTGNAITDVTRDGSRWVFTRGKTFSELGHTHPLSDISNLHSSWDAVLKAQKPNWLTAVSLATIGDLHANWDAILKAAPAAYVTRWPTAAEVGALTQSAADSRYALKTVTISAGAGLTGGGNLSANRTLSLAAVGTAGTYTKVTVDAYGRVTAHASLSAADIPSLSISKISGLQAALDKKLEATAFTELFEKVTLADGTTAIRAKYGLYSDLWLSAKGANPNQGEGGGGGLSYSRLDTWEGYTDEEKGGWVLSAYLGVRLHQDIENLKSGVAMSYAVTGTGNAITDVTRDGSRWVFTKGKTFSELVHTHPLSDISNLHSSWDSLLKEAPSAYITRWPSWTEVKDKPSTFTPSSHKHVKADITDFPATWAWSAISGKPTTFTPSAHQHPLSDLSNLHSSWDAILKAAPFAGVSRWPSWGEVTGKPTSFTPSSHTHAISQVSGLQAALDAKLPAATFEELFEKVTLSTGETAIRAKLGLYSDKWLSAKGANPNQGEGGGFAYTRLDTWEGYDSATMDGWVLSAKLGYSLYNDVKSLKAGAAVSFTIEGTGNAITDISKDGTRLVFTRGTTFALSSHQHLLSNISDLNSGWDSLLKAAPSAYVTRWPSWSEVSGKPTTFTPASHTHTISQVSDLHASWDALLKAAPSAYVTRWPSISEVTGKQSLAIKLNGGGTEGTNLFTYNGTAAKTVNITAASIGAPTKTGSGASGTWGISISGTAALAKGLTQNVMTSGSLADKVTGGYMYYAGGNNSVTDKPSGVDAFGMLTMQTAGGWKGQILISSNTNTGLYWRTAGTLNAGWRTVLDTDNYAATLDGRYLRTVSIATITDLHSSWDALLKAQKPTTLSGYGITDGVTTPAYTGSGNVLTAAAVSGHTITFTKGITAALASRKVNAGNGLTGGGTLTADITLNVSGDLSGVGSISASGVFSTSKATNTYLAGNQGQALVNSTASAGAYVMLHRGCSTNGYFTMGTYQDKYLLQYTAKSTVTAGNNSVTKSLTLLNEAGNTTFPGTVTAALLHATTGIYSEGYVSAKGQNTSSDMRLKRVLGDVSLPLERIAKAPSFEFRWRDGSGESAGSSAQYWKEALPSAVRERGGYLEMQYGNIALISAIAIARETMRVDREVARLREECRRLRGRVKALEEGRNTGSVA